MENVKNITIPENKVYTPFARAKDSTQKVMLDVIISLAPVLVIAYLVYGFTPLLVVLVSVASAVGAELLFSAFFFKKYNSIFDLSAVVTGILLALTLAPFTELYVVAFGGAMAVIFGKLLWGGLGRNSLNPAIVGREFMTIFFPAAMTASGIWYNKDLLNYVAIAPFSFLGEGSFISYLNDLFFKTSGAIGEYSIFFLILGGIYLLVKRRISWHIPFALLVTFTALTWIFSGYDLKFSLAGVILGTIFMATDMPSSATTKGGKLYYGAMIGAVAIACIVNDIRYEYMSYSILLLNAFSRPISNAFPPRVWGKKANYKKMVLKVSIITIAIAVATAGVILLHNYDAVQYLLFAYIIGLVIYFSLKGYNISKS